AGVHSLLRGPRRMALGSRRGVCGGLDQADGSGARPAAGLGVWTAAWIVEPGWTHAIQAADRARGADRCRCRSGGDRSLQRLPLAALRHAMDLGEHSDCAVASPGDAGLADDGRAWTPPGDLSTVQCRRGTASAQPPAALALLADCPGCVTEDALRVRPLHARALLSSGIVAHP